VFGIDLNRLAITASRIGKGRHWSHAGSDAQDGKNFTIANHQASARAGPAHPRAAIFHAKMVPATKSVSHPGIFYAGD
jgi:hypothetical protein